MAGLKPVRMKERLKGTKVYVTFVSGMPVIHEVEVRVDVFFSCCWMRSLSWSLI